MEPVKTDAFERATKSAALSDSGQISNVSSECHFGADFSLVISSGDYLLDLDLKVRFEF
jgi:hypothetical protein